MWVAYSLQLGCHFFTFELLFLQQSIGRVYQIDGKMIEVPNKWIDQIRTWNTCDTKRTSVDVDKKIIHAILLMRFDKEALAKFDVTPAVITFLMGKRIYFVTLFSFDTNSSINLFLDFIQMRVEGDSTRLQLVKEYVHDFCTTHANKRKQDEEAESREE